MTAFCVECRGSGERDMQGFLDCAAPGCNAAVERAALDTHLLALGRLHERDLVWEAYKLGQAKKATVDRIEVGLARIGFAAVSGGFTGSGPMDGMVTTTYEKDGVQLTHELGMGGESWSINLAPANNNTEKADDR